ncbi:hypothetical protein [Pedobacter zeae]|uniref:Uncharacterized protein n=1 Tax=Pedobacter zeae TaxID=1737356 RepID=A0A7W6KCL0_9SPHI|nr:hypothetical protein [Pedobacter zeae]MBB4109259.1 hypothetical protein [Pedobacter zeae]GGH11267.1 hypothetical protein GCM10007422_30370 [Pedobacter zeae]
MKTSNKLLISLAVLLIAIPIIVVAINAKVNYKERGIEDSYLGTQQINNESFEQKSKERVSFSLQSPFNAVQIKDAKGFSVQLFVKKDNKYGLKIQERFKNDLKYEVDANGVLQLSIKNFNEDNGIEKIVIVVYCPNISEVSVKNSDILEFSAHSDAVTLNLDNVKDLFLTGDITSNDSKGKITSIINPTKIGKLYLNLNKTKFSGYTNSFRDLYVNANKSEVEIGNMDENNTKPFPFDNLSIKTTDTSRVQLQNVNVKSFAGDFSDATTLQIPTPLLKQLFKK